MERIDRLGNLNVKSGHLKERKETLDQRSNSLDAREVDETRRSQERRLTLDQLSQNIDARETAVATLESAAEFRERAAEARERTVDARERAVSEANETTTKDITNLLKSIKDSADSFSVQRNADQGIIEKFMKDFHNHFDGLVKTLHKFHDYVEAAKAVGRKAAAKAAAQPAISSSSRLDQGREPREGESQSPATQTRTRELVHQPGPISTSPTTAVEKTVAVDAPVITEGTSLSPSEKRKHPGTTRQTRRHSSARLSESAELMRPGTSESEGVSRQPVRSSLAHGSSSQTGPIPLQTAPIDPLVVAGSLGTAAVPLLQSGRSSMPVPTRPAPAPPVDPLVVAGPLGTAAVPLLPSGGSAPLVPTQLAATPGAVVWSQIEISQRPPWSDEEKAKFRELVEKYETDAEERKHPSKSFVNIAKNRARCKRLADSLIRAGDRVTSPRT